MKKQIEISVDLYKRLESHSKGFDTPQNVIERLVTFFESHLDSETFDPFTQSPKDLLPSSQHLEIVFHPEDEDKFKSLFLDKKIAWILVSKTDGSSQLKVWECRRFSETSSVKGNLLSGHLRNWREKGIIKAEISTNKDDIT